LRVSFTATVRLRHSDCVRPANRPDSGDQLAEPAFDRDDLLERARGSIAEAISVRVAPVANSPRIRRSTDTEASLASIFATRDWLEPSFRAKASRVRPWPSRR